MVDDKLMTQEKIFSRFKKLFKDNDYAQALSYLDSRKDLLGDKYKDVIKWFIANRVQKISEDSGIKDESFFSNVLELMSGNNFKKAQSLVDDKKTALGDQYDVFKKLLSFASNSAIKENLNKDDAGILDNIEKLFNEKRYAEAGAMLDRYKDKFGDYYSDLKDWISMGRDNDIIATIGKEKIDIVTKLDNLFKEKKYNEANLLIDKHKTDLGDYYTEYKNLIKNTKGTNLLNSVYDDADEIKIADFKHKKTVNNEKFPDKIKTFNVDTENIRAEKPYVKEKATIQGLKSPDKAAVPNATYQAAYAEPEAKSSWLSKLLPWLLGLVLLSLLGSLLGLFKGNDNKTSVNTLVDTKTSKVKKKETKVSTEKIEVALPDLSIKPASITSTFPSIDLNSKTKLQGFATKFVDGLAITDADKAKEYTIEGVKAINDGTSRRAYYLKELKQWISEKDLFPEAPTVDLDPLSIVSSFPAVAKGAKVKLQDFATKFTDGVTIPATNLAKEYTVEGVKAVTDGDSKRAYYLNELKQWVNEADLFSKDNKNDGFKNAKFAVGQAVTIAEHATHYEERVEIPTDAIGKGYTVEEVRLTNLDDVDSDLAYKLSGLDKWVLQQDIEKQ